MIRKALLLTAACLTLSALGASNAKAQSTYEVRAAVQVRTGVHFSYITAVVGKTYTGLSIQQFTFKDSRGNWFTARAFSYKSVAKSLTELRSNILFSGKAAVATLVLKWNAAKKCYDALLVISDSTGKVLHSVAGGCDPGSLITINPAPVPETDPK